MILIRLSRLLSQTSDDHNIVLYLCVHMNTFEIEIKVLLGDASKAQEVIEKIHQNDPNTALIAQNNQLNHYFLPQGDFAKLTEILKQYIDAIHHEKLEQVILEGKNHSIRTREVDGTLLFVVKASVDDTTSSNGTARIEFEEAVAQLALHELDQLMLDHGFPYQSKRSRERKEYQYKDMHVCIDKNAGYGYVAEFEKVIPDRDQAEATKENIRKELELL